MRKEFRLYSTAAKLVKTPLHDAHVKLGGKMVPYAGYDMPVLYKGQSHIESHDWVRSKVGLFDVSHMLQHKISGKDSSDFLQKVTPIDLKQLAINNSSLSVLLNDEGGVVDDCIITRHGEDEFYMVTNAGCRESDVKFLKSEGQPFNSLDHSTFESTLLAIQGPKAAEILQKFTTTDLSKIYFGQVDHVKLAQVGSPVHLARSGYTGEDGFELSIPSSSSSESSDSVNFFLTLINDFPEVVKPIGLAARDSLRLEAGMCLYGQELTEKISPVEASLSWLIPKSRRSANESFNGASKILGQLNKSIPFSQRRVGLLSKGPAPRTGNKVYSSDGEDVGYITSGSFSPTLGQNVAHAYIDKKQKFGSDVKVEIRGKLRDARLSKLPFIAPNFYRG